MGFTFVFNPFTAPRLKSRHFSKKIHVPRFPFVRHCECCGKVFETNKWRRTFCSRQCKNKAFMVQWNKLEDARKNQAALEFLEIERADPNLAHYHFPKHRNSLGTQEASTSLKIIVVDGKERVFGAVWLERQIKRMRKGGAGLKNMEEEKSHRFAS